MSRPTAATTRAAVPMHRALAAALMGLGLLAAPLAQAQALLPFTGFSALPSFAWPELDRDPDGVRWDGSYARMSTGFQVSSSKRFGTHAGPTIGFEGGRMWRDGNLVYGIIGGFDYMTPFGGYGTPSFGSVGLTRDFAGVVQAKVGALVADNVLVYTKVGAAALNETWRFGPTARTMPFNRSDIAVRPDARVGVEWAVTDRLTVGVEAGVTGRNLR